MSFGLNEEDTAFDFDQSKHDIKKLIIQSEKVPVDMQDDTADDDFRKENNVESMKPNYFVI